MNDRRVLEAAHDAASVLGPDSTHTVASAAIDVSGRIPTGVNVLHFAAQYHDDVAAGRKTVTVRLDDPQRIGPVTMVFEDAEAEGYRILHGVVETIEQRTFGELTPEDVRRENAPSLEALHAGLRTHYPHITDDALVDVVGFRLR
ncbi:ASCH domain-containing protein [Nesterenkonia sp. HG001]|uniref:ASCH domain-containing protein n=1 Tax=Nesterenkonia sp. HG001 TaxID=2983207 RepID=UPI002AC41C38|nr:ASCH domain-containing protein [Nesterenkonia sp. HG001]MDZ5079095.1 ASCH domain-containing protein [Nesterenkonia sp. HG001]